MARPLDPIISSTHSFTLASGLNFPVIGLLRNATCGFTRILEALPSRSIFTLTIMLLLSVKSSSAPGASLLSRHSGATSFQ